MRRTFWIFAIVMLLNLAAYGQTQSLADVAREYKEKQAADEAAGVQPRVYTNKDLPTGSDLPSDTSQAQPEPRDPAMNRSFDERSPQQHSPEQGLVDQRAGVEWRNRIQAQQARVADLQARIDQLSARIHPQGGTAQYEGPYTRVQGRAMERLDQMRQMLDWQKQRLDQMQEAARHAGMHSTVYEP